MKTIIITKKAPKNIANLITINKNDFVIAVDGALSEVLKQNIRIDLVIGDLDSLEDSSLLKDLEVIKLNKEKDETDTFKAVQYAYENKDSNVYLLGGIKGNRIEHFIANYYLFDKYPNLIMMDDNSIIKLLCKGSHNITNNGYISLFGYNQAKITLKGFKYNLENYNLHSFDPLCISNELINKTGLIDILEGKIIVIKSKKK